MIDETLNQETLEPVSPFEDEFKTKWWVRYNNEPKLCSLANIQTLYTYKKITRDDFILITGQEPVEEDVTDQNVILEEKVNDLEATTATLLMSNAEKTIKLEEQDELNSQILMEVAILKGGM